MKKQRIVEAALVSAGLLCFFLLYLNTSYPSFKNNDSPETAAAAFTLGIAHAPGYPLYTMAAKVFSLFVPGNPAFRVNVFSAFLAVACLLFAYLISKKLFQKSVLKGAYYYFAVIFPPLFLGLWEIFWAQATEAKGGIYMLNLLFLYGIVYLAHGIINSRSLYAVAFIYGLSLTNHWPSMALLLPVVIYIFASNRRYLNLKSALISLIFLFAGFTPYLYALIRSGGAPAVRWFSVDTINTLLYYIFRKSYDMPAAGVSVWPQVKEFIRVFTGAFPLYWVALGAGIALLAGSRRSFLFTLVYIFLSTAAAVIFYNKTPQNLIELIDIFLIPAFAAMVFLVAAAFAYAASFIKDRFFSYGLLAAALIAVGFTGASNWDKNNASADYIGYDAGINITKSLPENSLYFTEGDTTVMSFAYMQNVDKLSLATRFVQVSALVYPWALKSASIKLGVSLPYEESPDLTFSEMSNAKYLPQNAVNMIRRAFATRLRVFRNYPSPLFDSMIKLPYAQKNRGLLVEIMEKENRCEPYIFYLYSFRSIYSKRAMAAPENRLFLPMYMGAMANQAAMLMNEGRFAAAARLFKKAILIPGEKPETMLYMSLAAACGMLRDSAGEFDALSKVTAIDNTVKSAFERLGYIYLDRGDKQKALQMFQRAVALGTQDPKIGGIIDKLSY